MSACLKYLRDQSGASPRQFEKIQMPSQPDFERVDRITRKWVRPNGTRRKSEGRFWTSPNCPGLPDCTIGRRLGSQADQAEVSGIGVQKNQAWHQRGKGFCPRFAPNCFEFPPLCKGASTWCMGEHFAFPASVAGGSSRRQSNLCWIPGGRLQLWNRQIPTAKILTGPSIWSLPMPSQPNAQLTPAPVF